MTKEYQAIAAGQALTQTTTTSNAAPFWYWPDYWHPPYVALPAIAPTWCLAPTTHVFACEHAKACKCGQVVRANPAPLDV